MADIMLAEALATTLNAALDITKMAVGVRDGVVANMPILDLQQKILEAQRLASGAERENFSLVRSVRQLEEEIRGMKEWKARQGEYKLEAVSPGALAFVSQPLGDDGSPVVWLCPNCFPVRPSFLLEGKGVTDIGTARVPDHYLYECRFCPTVLKVQIGRRLGR